MIFFTKNANPLTETVRRVILFYKMRHFLHKCYLLVFSLNSVGLIWHSALKTLLK